MSSPVQLMDGTQCLCECWALFPLMFSSGISPASFHALISRYSLEYERRTLSRYQIHYSFLFSGTLFCCLGLPKPSTLSPELPSPLGSAWVVPLCNLDRLSGQWWCSCVAYHARFPPHRVTVFYCLVSSVLKTVVLCIILFFFFDYFGRRANLVPITPSWLEVYVFINVFSVACQLLGSKVCVVSCHYPYSQCSINICCMNEQLK